MIKNCLEGQVESLGPQGDLITNIAIDSCANAPNLQEVKVQIGPHETIGIHSPDHQEPEATLIAVAGRDGFVEIGITGMNISEMLGIRVGEKVTISW